MLRFTQTVLFTYFTLCGFSIALAQTKEGELSREDSVVSIYSRFQEHIRTHQLLNKSQSIETLLNWENHVLKVFALKVDSTGNIEAGKFLIDGYEFRIRYGLIESIWFWNNFPNSKAVMEGTDYKDLIMKNWIFENESGRISVIDTLSYVNQGIGRLYTAKNQFKKHKAADDHQYFIVNPDNLNGYCLVDVKNNRNFVVSGWRPNSLNYTLSYADEKCRKIEVWQTFKDSIGILLHETTLECHFDSRSRIRKLTYSTWGGRDKSFQKNYLLKSRRPRIQISYSIDNYTQVANNVFQTITNLVNDGNLQH